MLIYLIGIAFYVFIVSLMVGLAWLLERVLWKKSKPVWRSILPIGAAWAISARVLNAVVGTSQSDIFWLVALFPAGLIIAALRYWKLRKAWRTDSQREVFR